MATFVEVLVAFREVEGLSWLVREHGFSVIPGSCQICFVERVDERPLTAWSRCVSLAS